MVRAAGVAQGDSSTKLSQGRGEDETEVGNTGF